MSLWSTQAQPLNHQQLLAPHHSTHPSSWNVTRKSDLWRHKQASAVLYMAWLNGSKAEKGACCVCVESNRKCWCAWTACRTTQITWITLSNLDWWVRYISRLAVAWQEHRRVLRSAAKLWRWVCSQVNLFEGLDLWIGLSICRYQTAGCTALENTTADSFCAVVQLNM